MKRFVQIGKRAFNTDQVTDIWFGEECICVDLAVQDGDEPHGFEFKGADRDKFLHWWENEADVCVIST